VAHGTPDPVVPKADCDAFEAERDATGAQMLVLSGTYHAYTDQGFPVSPPGMSPHQVIADAFNNRL
jgi:dienelactone hydrolase